MVRGRALFSYHSILFWHILAIILASRMIIWATRMISPISLNHPRVRQTLARKAIYGRDCFTQCNLLGLRFYAREVVGLLVICVPYEMTLLLCLKTVVLSLQIMDSGIWRCFRTHLFFQTPCGSLQVRRHQGYVSHAFEHWPFFSKHFEHRPTHIFQKTCFSKNDHADCCLSQDVRE